MAAPSQQDLRDAGRAEMVLRRPDLSIAPGSPEDVNLASQVAISDLAVQFAAQGLAGLFLDTAVGDALSTIGNDRTRLQRKEATQAIGEVTFSPVAGTTTGTILAGTRVATAPDESGFFVTAITNVSLSFIAEGPKSVAVTTVETGRRASASAGTVVRILDDLFDDFTVVNVLALAGGADREADSDYRRRVRGFPRTIAKATLRALAQGALGVPQVTKVQVVEEDTGQVSLYVSDAQGLSNPTLEAAVVVELDSGGPSNLGWRAAGQCVAVVGGIQLFQDVVLSLTVATGVSIGALVANAEAAVESFMDGLNQGATLYRQAIADAARQVDRRRILNVVVTTPAVDLVPSPNQSIRPGTISIA